jgi:exosome complex component RRP4
VVRARRQIFTLQTKGGEVDVILGVNGYVWIEKHVAEQTQQANADVGINRLEQSTSEAIYSSQNDEISEATRRDIARVSGVVRVLVEGGIKVDEENVRRGYEASLELDDEEGVMEFLNGERGGRICEMVLGGA